MSSASRHRVPGITVYPRDHKWSFTIYGEPDIVTGKRARLNSRGHASEDDAWAAALRKRTDWLACSCSWVSGRASRWQMAHSGFDP